MSVSTSRWVAAGRFGSPYEEEADANSHPLRYRHRPRGVIGPWYSGPAPDQTTKPTVETTIKPPLVALEEKMRAAAKVLREIEDEVYQLQPKAWRSAGDIADTAILLVEFAECIRRDRDLDAQ